MYAMSPAEIDTENLARTCLYGRQLPLPPNTDPGNPMRIHLLRRLCCARPPVQTDDLEETRMCGVLRSVGLNEAELRPPLYPRGRVVCSGRATVMRVTPKRHAASEQAH